ncbi:Protein CWH43 [Spathaspora sp. JA1]|nr:Protein CWH43 [Spathaspora sp. JA1]
MTDSEQNQPVSVANEKQEIFRFNGSIISYLHTVFAYSAFIIAVGVGCYLHYYKIVQNASYGYPDEWFPSVSATIGDRYPERSIFQILIALTAGPRFLLLLFNFVCLFKQNSYLPYIGLASGTLRTFMAGGWMYITSTDDHDAHDVFMISYMVLTIPWTVSITLLSERKSFQRKARFYSATAFFLTIIPLIYWFIQHKVHIVAGAYSIYAYFEWGLIFLDILFDAWSAIDFAKVDIVLRGSGIELMPLQQKKKPIEKSSSQKRSIGEVFTNVELLANLGNSFVFWSVSTSLFLCVWYFPLWHMGISGYEAAVVCYFISPLLLIFPHVRGFLAKYTYVTRVLTVLLGIGAYKVSDPAQRLLVITGGTSFGVISLIVELGNLTNHPKKLHSYILTILLGLLATSISKYCNFSNNPIWAIMHKENGGYNNIGIFLGLLAGFFSPTSFKTESSEKKAVIVPRTGGSVFLAGLGFGGYFFAIQSYLSDSGTLALWSWEGFPINGPTPITGAPLQFATIMVALILISKNHPNVFSGLGYNLVIGGGSALVLYLFSGWIGYIGSLVYSFYLISIGPIIWQNIVGYNLAGAFFLGFFVDILLSLGSVWIVAYAFVPGGPLLRERTDIILFSSFISILAGVFNFNLRKGSILKTTFVNDRTLKQTITILTVLTAIILSAFIKRYPTTNPIPYNSDAKSFNAGIWCVHFGLDNDMWSSETRMRDLIHDAEIDIIGLLESDTQRLIGGNRDFTQKIAEELGMYVDYGPGPNKHTWGAALLSKFPIVESKHHLLPSPVGELAPAIFATLDIYGELVDVIVFHSGQEEDVEDRRLQTQGVSELMGNSTRPLVLLSYLVTEPLKGNYNTYVSEKTRMYDIDNTDWDRWCEYILFRGVKKVAYARISRSTITDTELQVAKFKLMSNQEKHDKDLQFYYGNNYINEDQIEPNLRMPSMFRGDGVRGHRYHVFDEPRYFAQHKSQLKREEKPKEEHKEKEREREPEPEPERERNNS